MKAYLVLRQRYGNGDVSGCVVTEEGDLLGGHYSSNIGWLRRDLLSKFKNSDYEIVDLLETDDSDFPNEFDEVIKKNHEKNKKKNNNETN